MKSIVLREEKAISFNKKYNTGLDVIILSIDNDKAYYIDKNNKHIEVNYDDTKEYFN